MLYTFVSLTMMILNREPSTNGFPKGYFVIRSLATNRLLDVASDAVEDGAEVILFPQKESSLVEGKFNKHLLEHHTQLALQNFEFQRQIIRFADLYL
jgi:hypothetical protein